jgi:putative ABC transport system ATP-binding protein
LDIELNSISLAFESKEVIRELSYKFKEGDFYIIKGPSGCGKSTLLRLLSRLTEPDSGTINFSENLKVTELRRRIHLLTQLPMMFEGTIEENLLKPYSFGEYTAAAPDKDIYEKLLKELFPEGISLDETGGNLSQGQKQRVALCRTLLINPQVLLCDEPAASLDNDSRRIVDKAIEKFFNSEPDKTVIYISHHDQLHIDCDSKVIDMDQGCFKEAE